MFLSKSPFELSFQDYPEPDKWAVLVYFQGCNRACPDCHNSELRNEDCGYYTHPYELHKKLTKYCRKWHTDCVVFTGGDPLMERQLITLNYFLHYYGDYYNICVYTGAKLDEIQKKLTELGQIEYIKGGPFKRALKAKEIGKNDDYLQLASTNQFIANNSLEKLSYKGKFIFTGI